MPLTSQALTPAHARCQPLGPRSAANGPRGPPYLDGSSRPVFYRLLVLPPYSLFHSILTHMPRWEEAGRIPTQSWTCGYCGREVASNVGWAMTDGIRHEVHLGAVAICPRCTLPSFLSDDYQMPPIPYGSPVDHLPEDVNELYEETRRAMGAGSPTAASMAGRKLLMSVAVDRGAPADQNFAAYVLWLAENGFVTPSMKSWVDEIRELGNDANHEIELMTPEAAEELLTFVEMLLRVVYEYPERGQRSTASRKARDGGQPSS